MVKARVTSTKSASAKAGEDCGQGTPPVEGQKLKPTHAGQPFPPEKSSAQPGAFPLQAGGRAMRSRDGAEKSYFVCHTTWG